MYKKRYFVTIMTKDLRVSKHMDPIEHYGPYNHKWNAWLIGVLRSYSSFRYHRHFWITEDFIQTYR